MNDFYGLPTGILENDLVRLEYLTKAGPRIVRFSAKGETNMLAELPDFVIETTHGPFYFRGGHRLWCAPESMPETYLPDNDGLVVEKLGTGVCLTQPAQDGISKRMEIQLLPGQAAVTVRHHLHNAGSTPARLAPWALTMFRQGGMVLLPQPVGNADAQGLLNNRILALWPYTSINDPRLVLRDDFLLIHADPGLPPVKIGYYNPHGWLAYWLDGCLFRKTFDLHLGGNFPDGGCNSETYCDDRFVELESLGPLTMLEPGERVSLTEKWELFRTLGVPFIPEEIRKLLEKGSQVQVAVQS